ncbi:MAG: DUF4407 domain-containing protein [Pseudomonadota bacterium]
MKRTRPKMRSAGAQTSREKALRDALRRRQKAQGAGASGSSSHENTASAGNGGTSFDAGGGRRPRDGDGNRDEGGNAENGGQRGHKMSRFAAFVLPATGVNAERLLKDGSDGEFAKFVAMACLVIATTLFAFAGAAFFFSELIPKQWGWPRYVPILFLAIVWAYVIYNIDRMFLSSMLGRSGLDKLIAGSIRLALAIMLGIVISHPLKLMGVGQEIDIMIRIESLVQSEVAGELYEERQAAESDRLAELAERRQQIPAISEDGITEEMIIAGEAAGELLHNVETDQAAYDEWAEQNEEIELLFPYRPASIFIRPTSRVLSTCSFEVELIQRWGDLIREIDLGEGVRPAADLVDANNAKIREFGILAFDVVNHWRAWLVERTPPDIDDVDTDLIDQWFGISFDTYSERLTEGELIQNCSAGKLLERMWIYVENRRIFFSPSPGQQQEIQRNIADTEDTTARLALLREWEDIRAAIAGALQTSSYPYRTVIFNQLTDPDELETEFRKEFIDDYGFDSFFLFERETRETMRSYNYAIILIFVFIESMPVLMKLLAGMGKYERSVHANENERTRMAELAELAKEKRKLRFEAAIDDIEKREELRRRWARGRA